VNKRTPIVISLFLLPALSGCECECKAGDMHPTTPKTEEKAAPEKAAEPAAKTPAPAAEGLVLCRTLQDKRCVDQTETFDIDVPAVHAVLVTKTIPQTPKATTAWIAEDTGGAAPPNYTIATKEVDLSGEDLKHASSVTVTGTLTRPTKGWPKGSYRIDVQMDGKVVASKKFSIK